MRYAILLSLILLLLVQCREDIKIDIETFYEKSGYLETPRYEATIEYCQMLAKHSPYISYQTFGVSPRGRDLPLLVIDKQGNFGPEAVRKTDNAVLLIQACIHPGESEGKDAGLMFVRDLAFNAKYKNILDHSTILFIPIFNVDGHERFGKYNRINQNGPLEMGWRVTSQNYNLNRDFLKADAPEMIDWLKLFNDWLPEFFIDCHTTDGADYQYTVSYGLEIHGNMSEGLTTWQKDSYLNELEKRMKGSGYPIVPYVSFKKWHDPRSGLVSWVAPPFLSEGYTALQNRPGLLIETHMLKEYKTRVESTYEMIRHSTEIVSRDYKALRKLVREADEYSASQEFRNKPYDVAYKITENCDTLDFLGIDYEAVESELTGGTWFKYGNTPKIFRIPYFNKQQAFKSVELPEAYIIYPEWTEVIERLKVHGIKLKRLKEDTKITVKSFKFHNEKWNKAPYEGRFRINAESEEIEEERVYPKGSILVDMNQRASKVIAFLLEPDAPGSLFQWGLFNSIFEQKEYAESYVMEKMAREMLAKDSNLANEFEEKIKTDNEFANNQRKILNWFYSKSPYWDSRKNVYPVGKIVDMSSTLFANRKKLQ